MQYAVQCSIGEGYYGSSTSNKLKMIVESMVKIRNRVYEALKKVNKSLTKVMDWHMALQNSQCTLVSKMKIKTDKGTFSRKSCWDKGILDISLQQILTKNSY
jgi:phage FluMu protein Com